MKKDIPSSSKTQLIIAIPRYWSFPNTGRAARKLIASVARICRVYIQTSVYSNVCEERLMQI